MSDEVRKKMMIDRRGMLTGATGAAAVLSMPASAMIATTPSPLNASLMPSCMSNLYHYLRYTLMALQGVEKNMEYQELLAVGGDFASPSLIPGIAGSPSLRAVSYDLTGWAQVGQQLIAQQPNARTIAKFLASPAAQQLITQARLSPCTLSKISDDLRNAANMTPEQMANAIDAEIDYGRELAESVNKLAQAEPKRAKQIKQREEEYSRKQSIEEPSLSIQSTLRDMSGAHNKAGPYEPVNKNGKPLTDEEHKALGIGLHTPTRVSGCEHYSTITSRDDLLCAAYAKRD